VIVNSAGCTIVDALVIPRQADLSCTLSTGEVE
jgi:hypothetical protein